MSDTGFQQWLRDKRQAVLYRICWFVGHKWKVGEWKRSPYTTYTHSRDHRCLRCDMEHSEDGYFNALTQPEMFNRPEGNA